MTPESLHSRRQAIGFKHQYKLFNTLWTDDQTEALTISVRDDLESEFGPTIVEEKLPLQHAVGWKDDHNDHGRPEGGHHAQASYPLFVGRQVCHCLNCGQRFVWQSALEPCACSAQCKVVVQVNQYRASLRAEIERQKQIIEERKAKAEREREEIRKRAEFWRTVETARKQSESRKQYVVLIPDPFALSKIVDSIKKQLEERRDVRAHFVTAHLVQNKWTVLEFNMTGGNSNHVYVVLNGSGPGRAAWTITAYTPEQAVHQVAGRYGVGMAHPQ